MFDIYEAEINKATTNLRRPLSIQKYTANYKLAKCVPLPRGVVT